MRSLAAPALVTVALVAGLCGCQSCVDDSSQPTQSPPTNTGGVLGSLPRVRPRRIGPAHLVFRDAGAAGTDDAGGPSDE